MMCEFWDRLTGKDVSTAKIVDGVLVLSLLDAVTPQLWRLDLGKAQDQAFEVWENEDGHFVLGQRTPRGARQDIASFADKKAAVRALMVTSRAMENVPKHHDAGSVIVTEKGAAKGGVWPKVMTILIGLLVLLFLIGLLVGGNGSVPQNMNYSSALTDSDTFGGNRAGGMPMSADEFLMNQR